MSYIHGEGRNQASLFPVVLDDMIPDHHMCRVIDAFVDRLSIGTFGFERAQAAETERPGNDPRDRLKLYLGIGEQRNRKLASRAALKSDLPHFRCRVKLRLKHPKAALALSEARNLPGHTSAA